MFKKNLLNTTALAAIIGTAGVISVSNPAHSQEISVGAYVKTLIGFWSDDREDQNTLEMRNDAEVHVKASNTSDAGLEYGIAIELGPVSSTTDTEFQEADLFIRGEFGTVRVGDNDGAGDSLSVFAPTGFGTGGIDGNFGDWADVETAIKPVDTGDNTKITYFSPKVNNIQAGVSFTPQPNKGKAVVTDEATSGYENGIEFGVNFVGDVGDGINLQVGVTGSFQSAVAEGADDNFSFLIGTKVTVQDFTVGGGFISFGDRGSNDIGFNAGVQYTQGAFVFGVNMSYVETESIVTPGMTILGTRTLPIPLPAAEFALAGVNTPDFVASFLASTIVGSSDRGDVIDQINTLLDPNADGHDPANRLTGTPINDMTKMMIVDAEGPLLGLLEAERALNNAITGMIVGDPVINQPLLDPTADTTSMPITEDSNALVVAAGVTYHIAPGLKAMVDAVFYDDDGDGTNMSVGSGFVVLGGFQIAF